MEKDWLARELMFEDLELPPELESECASDLMDELNDGLPYMEDLDPDAEYIKAVAAGEYRHEMPGKRDTGGQDCESNDVDEVAICVPDEMALLAGFADIMGWRKSDMTEEGYLKAVIQNKTGKAAVIKDLVGIKEADGENIDGQA